MADAALIARIGGDATGLAAALDQATAKIDQFGKNIARKFDIRALTMASAAAIGFNIQGIAEGLSRLVAGMSKETEQDFKDIERLSAEVAEKKMANLREQATIENQLTLNLQDQQRLQKKIADQSDRSTSALKGRLEAEQQLLSLAEKEKEIRAKISKGLEEDQKLAAELAESRQREAGMLDKYRQEANREDAEKAAKEQSKLIEGDVQYAKEHVRLNEKIKQQEFEKKSDQEKAAALENEIIDKKNRQRQLDKGSNEWLDLQVQINDAEDQRVAVLDRVKKAEDEITDSKKQQLKLVNDIKEGMSWGTSKNWANASDKELQELLRRNQAAAAAIGTPSPTDIGNAIRLGSLNAESANIEKELNFRSKLRSDYRFRGEDYARSNFAGDPLAFDRVLQQVLGNYGNSEKQLDEMRKQTDLLRKIVPPAGTQRT